MQVPVDIQGEPGGAVLQDDPLFGVGCLLLRRPGHPAVSVCPLTRQGQQVTVQALYSRQQWVLTVRPDALLA
ncbi:hypothetical protein [Deinococcus sonorensis]|uniref:Uncharacterized protein n=1 Tax=Deinococcus sonorensis TaxID=309891 RepID=A0ABV8YAR1_9DEIO